MIGSARSTKDRNENGCRDLLENPQGNISLDRTSCRLNNNIKIDLNISSVCMCSRRLFPSLYGLVLDCCVKGCLIFGFFKET